jgi:hypothetical protein
MKWIRERDALIAQTLAFVQSVSRKKDDARKDDAKPYVGEDVRKSDAERNAEAALTDTIQIGESAKTAEPPKNIKILPANASSDFRTEIQSHVANFRAHQERFHREREQYYSTTIAKALAAVRDDSKPLR